MPRSRTKRATPSTASTAKDFHVWEDGKEQTVTSLSVETRPPRPRRLPSTTWSCSSTTPRCQCRTNWPCGGTPARFVGGLGRPGPLHSVVDFGPNLRISQGFTSLPGPLTQAIAGVQRSGQPGSGTGNRSNRSRDPRRRRPGPTPTGATIPWDGCLQFASSGAAPAAAAAAAAPPPLPKTDPQRQPRHAFRPTGAARGTAVGGRIARRRSAAARPWCSSPAAPRRPPPTPRWPRASRPATRPTSRFTSRTRPATSRSPRHRRPRDPNANDLVGAIGPYRGAGREHTSGLRTARIARGKLPNLRVAVDRARR